MEFSPLPPGGRGRAFFGLLVGLQDLFQRRVDLVVLSAVENPYFRKEIVESKGLVYADVA